MSGAWKDTGKAFLTPDGGLAVPYINQTGGASVKGQTVHITADGTVGLTAQGVPDCIGIVYQSGIPAGDLVYVVVSGIAEVLFIGNATAGHLARTFIAADGGFVAGQALSEAVPLPPFDSDKHFAEIGHVIDSRVGAGLARVNLHFN